MTDGQPTSQFQLHAGQTKIYRSTKHRILAAISGIQGGKSTLGALWLLDRIARIKDPKANFIITAPTHKILMQATMPCLRGVWPTGYYEYKEQKQEIILWDGRIVYVRTMTDPNSIEGIQNVAGIWSDEAGMYSRLAWLNIQARTSFRETPVLLTTTPYAINWLKKDVIDAVEKRGEQSILYVRWRSVDNPAFPKEEYERQKRLLPPAIFLRKYEGIHQRMEGLVFNVTAGNFTKPYRLPPGTRYFGGVDWGYKHAFAITIRAITPDKRAFCVSEFKKSGLTPNEKVSIAKGKQETFKAEMFYCGVDRPEMIQAFNEAGIPACGFFDKEDTRYREVMAQVEAHAELINSHQYQIFSEVCPHLEDEYETYHWPEDKEDQPVRENPVPINDDLISAERYVTIGTLHLMKQRAKTLVVPGEGRQWDSFNPRKPIVERDIDEF